MSENIVERVLFTNEEKAFQYRFTINEFRGETYLSIRKYFQDFEGEFVPSKEGASFPLTLESLFNLLDGIMEACSKAEINEELDAYFKNRISPSVA
jgi:hypothetical protein